MFLADAGLSQFRGNRFPAVTGLHAFGDLRLFKDFFFWLSETNHF